MYITVTIKLLKIYIYRERSLLNFRSGKFNFHINVLLVLLLFDLEPLRQSSADLKIENETFPHIHVNVFA